MYLLRGQGNGTFSAPVRGRHRLRVGPAARPRSATITGDGYPDLMGQPSGGSMRIYPSNGATGFPAATSRTRRVTATQQVGIGLLERRRRPRTPWCGAATGRWCSTRATVPAGSPAAPRSAPWPAATTGCCRSATSPATAAGPAGARQQQRHAVDLLPGTATGFGARTTVHRRAGPLRPRRLSRRSAAQADGRSPAPAPRGGPSRPRRGAAPTRRRRPRRAAPAA